MRHILNGAHSRLTALIPILFWSWSGIEGNKKTPLLAVENLWPTDTNLFPFVNTEYTLWIHSSSSELPDKADGSFSAKGHAIILKKTTLQCKTQNVRDRKQIHFKKFSLSVNWVRHVLDYLEMLNTFGWVEKRKYWKMKFKKKFQKQNQGGKKKKPQQIKPRKNPEWRKHAQRSRITKGVFKETTETTFLTENGEWYYESKRLVCNLLAIRWKENSNNLSFDSTVILEGLNFQVQCLLGRNFQVVLNIKKSLRM